MPAQSHVLSPKWPRERNVLFTHCLSNVGREGGGPQPFQAMPSCQPAQEESLPSLCLAGCNRGYQYCAHAVMHAIKRMHALPCFYMLEQRSMHGSHTASTKRAEGLLAHAHGEFPHCWPQMRDRKVMAFVLGHVSYAYSPPHQGGEGRLSAAFACRPAEGMSSA